jgi:hypothetical protein
MDVEYSQEVNGKVYAFRFGKWEQEVIAKALEPEIKKRERQIEKIRNDPNNEGQVTYQVKIEDIDWEITCLKRIIDFMSNTK